MLELIEKTKELNSKLNLKLNSELYEMWKPVIDQMNKEKYLYYDSWHITEVSLNYPSLKKGDSCFIDPHESPQALISVVPTVYIITLVISNNYVSIM